MLRPLALLCAVCLLWSASFSSRAASAELKWGRSAQSRQLTKSTNLQFRQVSPRQTVSYQAVANQVEADTNIATVAWEEEPQAIATTAGETPTFSENHREDHSIVVDRAETREPLYVAQAEDDPFAEIDEDLLPDFDEEEVLEETAEQIDPEPTIEELLDDLPEPSDPVEESTDDPAGAMTDEEFQDDLFGTDETESETEEAEKEETPESEDTAADPFDEPSIDQLPTESVEKSLDEEIKRRMDALESAPSKDSSEKESLDALNTTNLFDQQLENDSISDSDTDSSKLFGDAENLDIEIGGPAGTTELTEAERNQQLQQLDKERREGQKSCEDEFAKMKSDLINDIDLSLHLEGNPGEDFPYECIIGHSKHQPRQWAQITYNWKASGLCHKPLYFEQVQLERYGHSWGPYVQPIMSGVHFFGTLPILPYKMGIRTPTECVYTLGYYRPGNCAPYLVGGVPFTWRAALFQGGVTTGLIFAIP